MGCGRWLRRLTGDLRRKWRIYIVALITGLLGVSLILVDRSILNDANPTLKSVLDEIATALITTAVLSATVAGYFGQQLAKDVFTAALGYVLPEPLRAEVSWILGTSIVATKSRLTINISRAQVGVVNVVVTVERTVKNIGQTPYDFCTSLGVDDFGIGKPTVAIDDCKLTYCGTAKATQSLTTREKKIEQRTDSASLMPGDTAKVAYKFRQGKADNDDLWWFFFHHTIDPTVVVNIDCGLCHTVDFIGRNMEAKTTSEYGYVYEFEGALLATQPIKIRWWPEKPAAPQNTASA